MMPSKPSERGAYGCSGGGDSCGECWVFELDELEEADPYLNVSGAAFDERLDHITKLLEFGRRAVEHQRQFRDSRWLQHFESCFSRGLTMLEDMEGFQRQMDSRAQAAPNTWGPRSANTLYFRTMPPAAEQNT